MSWIDAARARLRLLSRPAAESRTEEEVRLHLDLEAERLVREQGIDAGEARRRALVAFGGVERHKESMRDGRGLAWLGGMTLDLKLGVRMLVKYPGLTLVGGLAMAFAIWVGTVTFEMVALFVHPTLPLPGGDRIVQIRNRDVEANDDEPRALHDFVLWRQALRSVTDLGAYRDVTRNLVAAPGDARPVQVAEISASAFRVASAAPLLGRALVADDERAGAPPVIVLGYDLWRTRFAGAADVVGRSVQLGDAYPTVVGVMRDGFAFPVAHEAWTPLRVATLERAPRAGPAITVFGRLAPGASYAQAQAELTTLGRRAAVEFPRTHEHLTPQVAPYARRISSRSPSDMTVMLLIEAFALMLVVLVCGNVALLLFARAATREGEIVVRSALGASRGRIVAQLFAEALVLGGAATAVGLGAAHVALRQWGLTFLEANIGRVPFWYDPRLSPASVVHALGLTMLAAVICGAMPARKITRGLGSRLRQGSAGGGGIQFGGVWTAVIVAQVAVTVAFPAVAYLEQREVRRIRTSDAGFAADQYLAVGLEMDAPGDAGADSPDARAALGARFGTALEALRRRVAAEPGVSGVTFVDRLPRDYHWERRVELEEPAAAAGRPSPSDSSAPEASTAVVDPSYFDVMQAPILAGRGFNGADLVPDPHTVIVDQGFVDQVLRGSNPIGRRFRFVEPRRRDGAAAEEPRPWLEIVGVVKDLGMGHAVHRHRESGVYLPAAPRDPAPRYMLVHVRGEPLSLASRVRALAAATDMTLRITLLQRADQVTDSVLWVLGLWLRATVVLTAIALLLSLAGIYAVLAFTVARRTREIGVRVALGASRRRVITGIFRRPLTQVCVGVAAGSVLIAAGAVALSGGPDRTPDIAGSGLAPRHLALLAAHAAVMLGVCLLACVVPTRRALRVQPTEALRSE